MIIGGLFIRCCGGGGGGTHCADGAPVDEYPVGRICEWFSCGPG